MYAARVGSNDIPPVKLRLAALLFDDFESH
jgi:hypothetical protein